MSTRTIEPTLDSAHNSTRPLAAQVLKKPLSIEVANPWRGRQTPCTAQEEHDIDRRSRGRCAATHRSTSSSAVT